MVNARFHSACKINAKTTKKLCTLMLWKINLHFSARVEDLFYDYTRFAFKSKTTKKPPKKHGVCLCGLKTTETLVRFCAF